MDTWVFVAVAVLEAWNPSPVMDRSEPRLPDSGSKLMVGVLMPTSVVCVIPWSSTAVIWIGPPATISGVTGMIMEAAQPPKVSKSMG